MASTDWKEVVHPAEADRHTQAAKDIVAMQQRKNQRFGVGRALHRKQNVATTAVLTVNPNLPPQAAQGLFAKPGQYPVWVRLSNGGVDKQADRRPDIRGFAFRVFGVSGPSALGGSTEHQDFSLINQTAFSFPTSELFTQLVVAAGQSPGTLLKWVFKTFGLVGGLKTIKKMAGTFKKPFSGFATESFTSVLPICCGPHACKVRLLPPTDRQPRPEAAQDWGADFTAQAVSGPLRYTLQLQFFVDEATTPIEDASVEWPERTAPFVTVGELLVQRPSGDALFEAQVDKSPFDPWQALAAHRPLGEVMRARKVIYFASEQARGAA